MPLLVPEGTPGSLAALVERARGDKRRKETRDAAFDITGRVCAILEWNEGRQAALLGRERDESKGSAWTLGYDQQRRAMA